MIGGLNVRAVSALVQRYTYLYSRSVPRVLEMVFWPVMDLLVWGFLTTYLLKSEMGVPRSITFLIGAMIFWDVLYRSQQAITISFLEDIWSHNLLNIFVAPIRVREFVAATYVVGFVKILLTVVVMGVLALLWYNFNLLTLGFSLIPFFVNLLVMGWAVGMFTAGLIIRWGQAAAPPRRWSGACLSSSNRFPPCFIRSTCCRPQSRESRGVSRRPTSLKACAACWKPAWCPVSCWSGQRC